MKALLQLAIIPRLFLLPLISQSDFTSVWEYEKPHQFKVGLLLPSIIVRLILNLFILIALIGVITSDRLQVA